MKLRKYIFVSTFILVIYGGLISSIFVKDKEFSPIENKVLNQCPKITMKAIKNGSFMDKFDAYVVDQFPNRINFIKLKNTITYGFGQREFKKIYIGKTGRLLEKFDCNMENIDSNIKNMNLISEHFNIDSVGMFIPNSIEIYKNELPFYAITDSQEDILNHIKDIYRGEFYSPYQVLLKNKNKDIYFKTDHHWTQFGAKLMYEDYYNEEINSKYLEVTDNFFGTYYSKTLLNKIKPDSISAYEEFSKFSAKYDNTESKSLYDKSKLEGKNKYQYFLNGDPALMEIYGEGKGEVLIFKDSFAHNYIPFLAKKYSKIHVLDPRYLNIDISEYIRDNKISKIYYIYSISTLNSSNIFAKYKNQLK